MTFSVFEWSTGDGQGRLKHMANVTFSDKKARSILYDMATFKLEGDHVSFKQQISPIVTPPTGRNSHTYRTDRPLVSDSRSYKAYLFDLSTIISRKLNKQQYIAVIAYFSHATVTIKQVSDELGYGKDAIGNAIKKAIHILKSEI